MDSFLFVFSFGQSKGKADKFYYIINMLDVLRESLILVAVDLCCAVRRVGALISEAAYPIATAMLDWP